MKGKVLIIDDSATIRSLIRVHLAGHQLEFIEASDGATGMLMAQKERPVAMIVDLKMPHMDGFTFCRAVRASNEMRNVPIILLTGTKGEDLAREAARAGATFFLTKPIDGDKLVFCLSQCMKL